jgi:ubiquinone/menaquinone biosynthesis C-methylase UbiE
MTLDRREELPYLAPFTPEILRVAVAGLNLPERPRVLDLCCGLGTASWALAVERGAVCTGVDANEPLLLQARRRALEAGLTAQLEFLRGDARHLELPLGTFDLLLALGGALTYTGRPEGLERARQLLKPGGALLVSDLVYRDSPPPEEVVRTLEEEAPESPVAALRLEPAVRAVFEEGIYRFETEASYRALLDAMGFEVLFAFPVPESAWNRYYSGAVRSREAVVGVEEAGPAVPAELVGPVEPIVRIPVGNEELASYYCWGGRWGVDYLVIGARAFAPVEGGGT